MGIIYQKPSALTEKEFHYCPGCSHGIIHKLVAEVLSELNIVEDTVGVSPVGCSVFAYDYFTCDMQQAAHGRAPAVATGIKRALPKAMVFTYQGDGDLASIGMGEIIHSAARGEKFTTIFVNNAIYGMTGGQMAPTTLIGQKATTAPLGRNKELNGSPLNVSEMLAQIDATAFVARVAVDTIPHLTKAKKAIKTAFELQQQKAGFSFVEILATCPTNWGKTPLEAVEWLQSNMIPQYPLGVFKDAREEARHD